MSTLDAARVEEIHALPDLVLTVHLIKTWAVASHCACRVTSLSALEVTTSEAKKQLHQPWLIWARLPGTPNLPLASAAALSF
eukprot:CAMPEP_0171066628 /NCGR_PEP_ID=MMETSP0766_2-20121228/7530_1 /TAXON_ID=439317 /ORGANISM="Gambierdiscus australes, Strain CAWD 149" /LENGTH=81 /DNA_ID=CAMNT_0011522813 /DNA_START=159 /DNA_END=405 /DNA_ORIENTATION=+